MQKKLYGRLRNISVYKRLWISNVIVAIIPAVLISSLLLLIFWNDFNDRIGDYAGNLTLQMESYIDLQVQQLNNDIANFSTAQNTLRFLSDYPYMSRKERYLALEDVRSDISSQFSKLYAISDIVLLTNDQRNNIHVYGGTDKSLATAYEKIDSILARLSKPGVSTVYDALYAPDSSENGGMIIAKRILGGSSGIIYGYIIVHMRESFLTSIYINWDLSRSGNVYILDDDDRIMSSNSAKDVGRHFPKAAIVEMGDSRHGVLNSVRALNSDERFICAYTRMSQLPISIVNLVPRNYLASNMRSISAVAVLAALVLILLSSGTSTIIMNSITRPITKLIGRMRQLQNNQLVTGEADPCRDELAIMSNTFDQTVRRLRASIEEIRRAEQEKVNLELRALTAQISPHFLTNTLNTIKSLAHLQNVSNVESMVGSLINILTVRLGKWDALVSLSEEVALLEDYITLQKYRYFNEITFDLSIDPSVRNCLIPVFTLQPLVENALRHGGLDVRMDGRVLIKACPQGKNVLISVIDNGAGMSPARLDEVRRLQNQQLTESSDHIGVQNVHQRIRLLFGPEYGLRFMSRESAFTEVDILVPFSKNDIQENKQP